MAFINDDQKTLERKANLQDNAEPGITVAVPLRDRINKKLLDWCKEEKIGTKVTEAWHLANHERAKRIDNLDKMLELVDEFIDPIYEAPTDWASTLHLPTTLTVAKSMHARFTDAILNQDPMFVCEARQAAGADRSQLVQDLMRYTLKDWYNKNNGVDAVVDRWIWSWVLRGDAVLKSCWEKEYTTFVDVDTIQVPGPMQMVQDETGTWQKVPTTQEKEVERKKTIEVFNGPMCRNVQTQDIVCIGSLDPQEAEMVLEQDYLSADELWSLVDQKIFDEDGVAAIIKAGADYKNAQINGQIEQNGRIRAGYTADRNRVEEDKYQIIESYLKVDMEESGVYSDIVIWVHGATGEVVRATYLHRISYSGLRPYFRAVFHLRDSTQEPVGLLELLYSLSKEIDSIHNIRMDVGIIASIPFGFYRPTSSMSEEKLRFEPGSMIPVDNPQTDIVFPNLGNRTSFGFQEEAALMNQVDRLTSISDMSLGIMSGNQGAARTATGARGIMAESNTNLNVFLMRLNRPWKQFLKYTFCLLQYKMPAGKEFRILGDDGKALFRTVKSREEIAGMYDFELEPNSANSNKAIQMQTAQLIFQVVQNPLFLQLGLVTPLQIYEGVKAFLRVNGVKDYNRYLMKPQGYGRVYTPEELANLTLSGQDIKLDPTQDLQGFIAYVDYIIDNDELLGQFNEQQAVALFKKQREAKGLAQALQQAQAQAANIAQMQQNQGMSSNPIAMQTMLQQVPEVPGQPV